MQIRPTPTMRSAKSSGSRAASVRIAMPPIECPISTIGPIGAAVAITWRRSEARWSIVEWPSGARPDLPCERWS